MEQDMIHLGCLVAFTKLEGANQPAGAILNFINERILEAPFEEAKLEWQQSDKRFVNCLAPLWLKEKKITCAQNIRQLSNPS